MDCHSSGNLDSALPLLGGWTCYPLPSHVILVNPLPFLCSYPRSFVRWLDFPYPVCAVTAVFN